MNPAVGIDLGTTNTVVAVQVDDTGPQLLPVPQPNDHRQTLEPLEHLKSAVYFESATSAAVGAFAARRLDSLRSIKSKMGTRWTIPHPYDKRTLLTPAYISAHILKCASDHILRQYPAWDRRAVVTVPASFNTDQRNDTLLAARMAGLADVRLLDEPTAAFYYFFDQNREAVDPGTTQTVLVFDFGGGTLDVSIIRVEVRDGRISIDPVGRSRYNDLGGDDIDLDLASFLLALWLSQEGLAFDDLPAGERRSLAQLFRQKATLFKEEAEDYLKNDMPLNEVSIFEELQLETRQLSVGLQRIVTRGQYEEVTGRFFGEKSELNIFRPIRQALDVAASIDASLSKDSIDLVLYTGGASRMGAVRASLEAYFAGRPCFAISDDEACNTVALGAASCRYDEMHKQRGVTMRSRLLESVMTRDESGRSYISIVPLECEPSSEFKAVAHSFKTDRPAVTLRLPLFRGVGPTDHNLTPMEDLRLRLPRLVAAGVPFTLHYRMTQNKTIEVRARFAPPSEQPFEVVGELSVDASGQAKGPKNVQLAKVN